MYFITELITSIGTFADGLFGAWLPTVIETITGNPILVLFVVAVPLCGIAISAFRRIINVN